MKMKVVMVLMAAALMLSVSETTQAVSLKGGPLLFKTYNWEVGTSYLGGTPLTTYFRNDTASYYQSDGTLVSYTGAANQGLFSDLTIVKDPSLNDGEDTWGLLEVRQLELGEVLGGGNVGDPIGPATPQDKYWDSGDNGEWIRGVLWGAQDQAIEWLATDIIKIYSTDMEFNLYEMDTSTYNPQSGVNPTPWMRDKTKPGEFDPDDTTWDPWVKDTGDNLLVEGSGSWFRFLGDTDDPDGSNLPVGTTDVYLDVDPTKGKWGPLVQDWWDDPASADGSGRSDIWQTWNIGKPTPYANGWVGSEDSGRAYIIPEPMTMLGLFLGVSSLTGYLRKRRTV